VIGFSPRGFSLECNEANFDRISSWKYLFEPYYVHSFVKGHSGTDIGPIKGNPFKAGLQPDSQRYFDYHHAANDTLNLLTKGIRTWCSNNGFINLFN
jgi:hypothetical protein